MLNETYVWAIWAVAFLVPWTLVYVSASSARRRVIWRSSLITSLFGLTEPIFVPRYWNPPSLFDLAARTGFDIESLIFSFAIGGIGAAGYAWLRRTSLLTMGEDDRRSPWHRLHWLAVWGPFVLFVPLALLPWNPIYASIASLLVGAAAAVACRPDLWRNVVAGSLIFLAIYAVFMLGLVWGVPGYVERVWRLSDLSGVLIAGIPLEELVFGLAFGAYWSGAYEHLTWQHTVVEKG